MPDELDLRVMQILYEDGWSTKRTAILNWASHDAMMERIPVLMEEIASLRAALKHAKRQAEERAELREAEAWPPCCDNCGHTLKEAGAIMLSPPLQNPSLVWKVHLCIECWELVQQAVKNA